MEAINFITIAHYMEKNKQKLSDYPNVMLQQLYKQVEYELNKQFQNIHIITSEIIIKNS